MVSRWLRRCAPLVAVAVSACAAPPPADPAFHQARMECHALVSQMYPPRAPSGPVDTRCQRYGNQVNCTSTQQRGGGLGLTEAMERSIAMDDCMRSRGYR